MNWNESRVHATTKCRSQVPRRTSGRCGHSRTLGSTRNEAKVGKQSRTRVRLDRRNNKNKLSVLFRGKIGVVTFDLSEFRKFIVWLLVACDGLLYNSNSVLSKRKLITCFRMGESAWCVIFLFSLLVINAFSFRKRNWKRGKISISDPKIQDEREPKNPEADPYLTYLNI